MSAPRRSGDTVAYQALILGATPMGDRDLVVRLLTLEEGKISAIAKNAKGSSRRFGASLEAGNYVLAQLVVPRDPDGSASALWRLDRTELREPFLHLRSAYSRLDAALFAVALMRDFVPEGLADENLFRGLGRYLRDLDFSQVDALGALPRIAFWAWTAQRLGYGDFVSDYLFSRPNWTETACAGWTHALSAPVPDFSQLWPFYRAQQLSLSRVDEVAVYRKWVEITGLSWPHFERWIGMSASFLTSRSQP